MGVWSFFFLTSTQQWAVLKFARYTGAHAIAGRHTPSTLTNQLQTSFSEPYLLILTNPITDHQPIKEVALGNIPTIAFCDIDSPMRYVDIDILTNNKGKHNIGCLFWLLTMMVLHMRHTIASGHKWDVMVDLFFSAAVIRVPPITDAQWGADVPVVAPISTALGSSRDATQMASAVPIATDGWGAAIAPPVAL